MCRWLAYSGAPIFIEDVIIYSDHSLIDQSLNAKYAMSTTNGDGFGIGWYGKRDTPGVYKSIRPAWNDDNLHSLASQIESHLFLAHVRATTGTAVQRSNCHPFQCENWIFVHNGDINGFESIKRELVFAIAPELYSHIRGTTDSEIMFYLAITFGMTADVAKGVARMVGFVEQVAQKHGIDNAVQMSLGISDGRSIYAFRYSTEGNSRTLFHSAETEALKELAPGVRHFSSDARAIVSEPLSRVEDAWVRVPESSFVTVTGADVRCERFAPMAPPA